MEEKKYIVAKGNTTEELERTVSSLRDKNYELQGGVCVSAVYKNGTLFETYCQALKKIEE